MREQTVVPSTSVRTRSFASTFRGSLSTKASSDSIFGSRFVRAALLLVTAGFVGLAGSAMAAETNAAGGSNAAKKAAAAASAPIKVPMTAEHWQTESGAFEKIQGIDAIALHEGGTAFAKAGTLKDGPI